MHSGRETHLTTGPLENRKGGAGNPKPEADLAGRRSTSVLCPGQPAAGRPWRERGSRAPPAAQPPTQARTCAHTHPFPALGCREPSWGAVRGERPSATSGPVRSRPPAPSTRCCLKPSPGVFPAEAPRGVHGGQHEGSDAGRRGSCLSFHPGKGHGPRIRTQRPAEEWRRKTRPGPGSGPGDTAGRAFKA